MASKIKVAVTGATGRTACFLVRKILAASDRFDTPECLVRSIVKAKEKYEDVWDKMEGHCHEVDIIADGSTDIMSELLKGCDVLVILTSAVGVFKDGKICFLPDDGTNKGSPEIVDGLGQERQIDAAKKAGIGHLVMVGTMGTTNAGPDEFFGYYKYKRQAEEYLLASGLVYTIVKPCMLVDGEEGMRELVFSKGDQLRCANYSKEYQVARKSVAEVVFQTLLVPEAKNKVFDLLGRVDKPPTGPVDYVAVFKETTSGL